jgi:hypothetical protein
MQHGGISKPTTDQNFTARLISTRWQTSRHQPMTSTDNGGIKEQEHRDTSTHMKRSCKGTHRRTQG